MRPRRQNTILQPAKILAKKRDIRAGKRATRFPEGLNKTLLENPNAKICVIRSLGGIGDVLMMTPGLRELKRRHPGIELTVAVDRTSTAHDIYYALLRNTPFIDRLIDARYVDKSQYERVLDISAVCVRYEAVGLPVRSRIDMFSNHLGLFGMEDCIPYYKVEPSERYRAKKFFEKHELDGFTVALHTASNDAKRSWPIENQLAFVRELTEALPGVKFLVFDYNNIYEDWHTFSNVVLQKDITVRRMAALMEQCDFFVGPDSGPMHLAGALSIPSVVVFGAIPPEARINHYPTHTAVRDESLSCLGCWYNHCPIDFACMKNITSGLVSQAVLTKLEKSKHKIVFQSRLDPCDGYGSSAEQMALALSRLEPEIRYAEYINDLDSNPDWVDFAQPETFSLVNQGGFGSVYLGYFQPNHDDITSSPLVWKADRRYIYTTFESTKVPSAWVPRINTFDKLFVSCEEIKKAFSNSGVSIPIVKMPLGVTPNLWPYKERSRSGRPFRFLVFANSTWGDDRKNYAAALRAFSIAFKDRADVELVMKVTGGSIPHDIPSNVRVISGRYSQQRLLKLLYSVDCLLFPSKGEGFGLPPREAMATGIPVAAPCWSGLEDIMKLDFNYSVPFTMEKATYDQYLVAQNDGSTDFGLWCKPAVDKMVEIIKDIPNDYDDVLRRGKLCSEWVRENETYDMCAQRLLDEILEGGSDEA